VGWRLGARLREQAAAAERRMTLQEVSDYWNGRFEAATEQANSDEPDALVIAANAAFRRAMRDANGAPTADRLDQVMQAYVSVLKNNGFTRDTAFNYEYVARVRDASARAAKRPASPPTARTADAPDDLPTGPTLHGRPGTHPPATRGEEFEVLTPLDYGERETRPEPTPGRPRPRKG
jgi:hypothetical protein